MTKESTLLKKIGKELARKKRKSIGIARQVKIISRDRNLECIFKKLATDENLRRLLLSHPRDILARPIGGYNEFLPIFIDPSDIQLEGEQSETAALFAQALDSSDVDESSFIPIRPPGISDDKWMQVEMDLKDILAYFLLIFLRENALIRSLIEMESFTFKEMKDILGNYSDFSTSVVEEMIKDVFIGKGSSLDPIIREKIDNVVFSFAKGFANPMRFLNSIGSAIPDIDLGLQLESEGWLVDVLECTGLALSEYVTSLDYLHECGQARVKSLHVYCINCYNEEAKPSKITQNRSPASLLSGTCTQCGGLEAVIGLYEIEKKLFDILTSQDGLLAAYIGWLLYKRNVQYKGNLKIAGSEFDIVAGKTVIECKMFSETSNYHRVEASLEESLRKLETSIERVRGVLEIEKLYFVWNRFDFEDEGDSFATTRMTYHSLFNEYDLEIISPNEIRLMTERIESSK